MFLSLKKKKTIHTLLSSRILHFSPYAGSCGFVRPPRAVMQPSLSPRGSPEHPFSHWISGGTRKTDFRAKNASDFRRRALTAQFPERPRTIACSTLVTAQKLSSCCSGCFSYCLSACFAAILIEVNIFLDHNLWEIDPRQMMVCSFAMKCTWGSTWTRHFPFLVDTQAFIAMHCIKVGGKKSKVHVTFPFLSCQEWKQWIGECHKVLRLSADRSGVMIHDLFSVSTV